MNIQECISVLLGKASLSEMVETAKLLKVQRGSEEEVQRILECLSSYFKDNKHRDAVATLLALLLGEGEKIISKMRRTSMFRASSYKYRASALQKGIAAALSVAPTLNISPEKTRYLESVQALLTLSPQANRLRQSLVIRLRARQKTVIKTLMACVNQLFSTQWLGDQNLSSETVAHWSSEDLASAFSYLLALFREEFGFKNEMWNRTDENCGKPTESVYFSLLIDAAKLTLLLDAETLLDGLPYQAHVKGKTVTVESIDPGFEKSVRLGYIQAEVQVIIRALHLRRSLENSGPPSIENFLKEAFDAGLAELAEVKTKPLPRIVLMLPNVDQFYEPFSMDHPYLEEVALLYENGIENFRSEADSGVSISGSLTALDILKLQRYFRLIDALYREKLESVADKRQRASLTVRSTIPIIKREDLVQSLARIISKDKVEEVLGMVSLQGTEKYLDIQYRPLVAVADTFAIAPAIFAKSNLIRNIVVENKLRTAKTTANDPMQKKIVATLKAAGFLVRANFEFNIKGRRETDILCFRDGNLFVFECKNSYHPCSPHELRTSYEHIKTAEKQLDIRLEWLRDQENQKKLLSWLEWNCPVTSEVYTGVITANRLFNGSAVGRHPVRQAHEMVNVLLRGEIQHTDDRPPVKFWRGDSFHSNDLIDYLSGKTIIQAQNEQLQPFSRVLGIGEATLVFSTYSMDLQTAAEAMQDIFQAKETTEIDELKSV